MAATLELDLLRTFAAVAEAGGFTAAAGRVARTQSAVSMQIRRLEEAVGRRIFERSSRSLALTDEGRVLLDYARRLLDLNDEAVRRVAQPRIAGSARLGITEYFVPGRLPLILARFAAAHPGVQLEVRMGLSSELRVELAAGRLDAAIVRMDPLPGRRSTLLPSGATPARQREVIWREPQVWVAGESLQLDRQAPVPLVALPRGCVLRQFAIDTFRRQKREWRLAFTGSSMASVQAAVVAGLGVSIVSRSSVMRGMSVLPQGRIWPGPGPLEIGLLKGKRASEAIVAALSAVLREALEG